jgi:hypothetical protein
MGLFTSKTSPVYCPVCGWTNSAAGGLEKYMTSGHSSFRDDIREAERQKNGFDFVCHAAIISRYISHQTLDKLVPSANATMPWAFVHNPLVRNDPRCTSCNKYFSSPSASMSSSVSNGAWHPNYNKIWADYVGRVRWLFNHTNNSMMAYCLSCAPSSETLSAWNFGVLAF